LETLESAVAGRDQDVSMSDKRTERLDRERVQLLVVDIQEKLLPHVFNHEDLVTQSERIVRAAVALDVPVTVSEQYRKGLGPTTPRVAEAAGDAPYTEKTTFSYCQEDVCRQRVTSVLRPQVLLIGIEAHICVQQTALDLLEMQMQPFVLADAVGSRRELDYQVALERMRHAGVIVTTVESAIFQLVGASGTELFKRILPIVK
jgi:isochorismate hydrolase